MYHIDRACIIRDSTFLPGTRKQDPETMTCRRPKASSMAISLRGWRSETHDPGDKPPLILESSLDFPKIFPRHSSMHGFSRENLPENPTFSGKIDGFLQMFR